MRVTVWTMLSVAVPLMWVVPSQAQRTTTGASQAEAPSPCDDPANHSSRCRQAQPAPPPHNMKQTASSEEHGAHSSAAATEQLNQHSLESAQQGMAYGSTSGGQTTGAATGMGGASGSTNATGGTR